MARTPGRHTCTYLGQTSANTQTVGPTGIRASPKKTTFSLTMNITGQAPHPAQDQGLIHLRRHGESKLIDVCLA